MAHLSLKLPTEEEEELLRRFTVNKNYLQATSGFIRHTYGRRDAIYDGLTTAVDAQPAYRRIQRSQADLDEVRRFMVWVGPARFSCTCRC